MIGHLTENPPRFLGRREIKGQWREKWLNLTVRIRPKQLKSEFHSWMIVAVRLCRQWEAAVGLDPPPPKPPPFLASFCTRFMHRETPMISAPQFLCTSLDSRITELQLCSRPGI
jgi:hypothetical protein